MPPQKNLAQARKNGTPNQAFIQDFFQMVLAAAEPIGVSPNLDPGPSQLFRLGSTVGHP